MTIARALPSAVFVCAVLGSCGCIYGQFGFSPTTITLTGQTGFDAPTGEVFSSLGTAIINGSGAVAFAGNTRTSPGGATNSGLFVWQGGMGHRILKQGDPLGDHPSLLIGTLRQPYLDDTGRLTVQTSTGSSGVGVLQGTPGAFHVLALSGADPNPGGTYARPDTIFSTQVAPSGAIQMRDSSNRIWAGLPGSIGVVASPNSPAPGYPSGGPSIYNFTDLGVDDTGRALVMANTTDGTGNRVLFTASQSGQTLLAGPGSAAPGGGTFPSSGAPGKLNAAGIIGFHAPVLLPGESAFRDAAFMGTQSNIHRIAIKGDAAPGAGTGATFVDFGTPTPNEHGSAMFVADTTVPGGPAKLGLWITADTRLHRAVALGAAVTNMPTGTTLFSLEGTNSASYPLAFNDRDQVAFLGRVSVPGMATTFALLATDLNGDLVALAATGFGFQVGPGDSRVVQDFVLPQSYTNDLTALNGQDGFGTFFNDSGRLVFGLRFTDGTFGTFVATVPAPACGGVLGTLMLLRRPRRRERRMALID
jgi:hypothetical protein